MGDIGTANVEGPGDRMGIGDDEGVGLELLDLGAHALELVGGRFAGELQIMRHHRAVGRRRAVRPDRIDRIGLGRDQDGADAGAGLGEAFGALGAVQPGVVAELLAGHEVRLDPRARRGVGDVLDGEQGGIDLVARLGGVAAVDEQRSAIGEDDRGAGRSGEAGEPGETLLAGRQIFVLMAVGMGHDETVEPASPQLGAQRRDARRRLRRLRRLRRIVEGLELRVELAGGGFVHGGNLMHVCEVRNTSRGGAA